MKSGRRSTLMAVTLQALVALTAAGAGAQEREPAPTIGSDRPGVGNGARVLTPRVLQVEAGLELADVASGERLSVGQLLLRHGLSGVELRAGLNSFVVLRGARDDEGFEDLALGAKVPLLEGRGFRGSAMVTTTLPTGSGPFTTGEATLEGAALADWALGPTLGVSFNLAYGSTVDGDGETVSVIVTPAWSGTGVEGLGVYAGYAGAFVEGPGPDRGFFEAGVTYLLDDETQLDLNGGYDPERDVTFVGVGIARRLSR